MHSSLTAAASRPHLTAADEADLARRRDAGDASAVATFVERNVGLVCREAARMRGRGVEFDDLVQAGLMGIRRAAELFDPALGMRFSTYAHRSAHNRMVREIDEHAGACRLPVWVGRRISRLRRAVLIAEDSGENPDPYAVALAGGETPRRAAMLAAALRVRDAHSFDDAPPGSTSLAAMLPDPRAVSSAAAAESAEAAAWALRVVAELPPRWAEAVRLRFGLDGAPGRPFEEIGPAIGVTGEAARSIVQRALAELRFRHAHPEAGPPPPRRLAVAAPDSVLAALRSLAEQHPDAGPSELAARLRAETGHVMHRRTLADRLRRWGLHRGRSGRPAAAAEGGAA